MCQNLISRKSASVQPRSASKSLHLLIYGRVVEASRNAVSFSFKQTGQKRQCVLNVFGTSGDANVCSVGARRFRV